MKGYGCVVLFFALIVLGNLIFWGGLLKWIAP